jgi:hypothetical protein
MEPTEAQLYRDIGEIKGIVVGMNSKIDTFQHQLDMKLPTNPTLKILGVLVVLLSGWLGALTGATVGKKPSNMIFNVTESDRNTHPKKEFADARPRRAVDETRKTDDGVLGGDILRGDP